MINDGIAERHKKTLFKILADCPKVKQVILFGSRAMGSYTTQSDIDIALVGDELTLTDQAKILDAIEQTNIPQKVEIVLYRTIRSDELWSHI